MRVRNPARGTVVDLDQETANAYVHAGWRKVNADRPSPAHAEPDESHRDESADVPKPRRRRTSK